MKPVLPGLLGVFLLSGAALAQSGSVIESVYTDVKFDECTTIESDEVGGISVCPGYHGYPVMVGESDLRMTVSYGAQPLEEPALQQGFAAFNHIGQKIEWRVEHDDDMFMPRATILRWYLAGEDGTDKYQILVVTQLKYGETCHMAYVDALATRNANEVARKIADTAGSFDCRKEPEIVQPFTAF